jgi:hypothetical protein
MKTAISRTIAVAAAVLTLASGTALAQGKGQDKQKHKDNGKQKDIVRVDSRGTIVAPRTAGKSGQVPPGLAKKPGQMPPGQYKKYYPTDGARVLRDVLGRRGYTVVRTTPYGESQYVYYRLPDGTVQRAIVSPGAERLGFSNVPQTVLQQVLSVLY